MGDVYTNYKEFDTNHGYIMDKVDDKGKTVTVQDVKNDRAAFKYKIKLLRHVFYGSEMPDLSKALTCPLILTLTIATEDMMITAITITIASRVLNSLFIIFLQQISHYRFYIFDIRNIIG